MCPQSLVIVSGPTSLRYGVNTVILTQLTGPR